MFRFTPADPIYGQNRLLGSMFPVSAKKCEIFSGILAQIFRKCETPLNFGVFVFYKGEMALNSNIFFEIVVRFQHYDFFLRL